MKIEEIITTIALITFLGAGHGFSQEREFEFYRDLLHYKETNVRIPKTHKLHDEFASKGTNCDEVKMDENLFCVYCSYKEGVFKPFPNGYSKVRGINLPVEDCMVRMVENPDIDNKMQYSEMYMLKEGKLNNLIDKLVRENENPEYKFFVMDNLENVIFRLEGIDGKDDNSIINISTIDGKKKDTLFYDNAFIEAVDYLLKVGKGEKKLKKPDKIPIFY
jgi:hypothetical protein